MKILARYYYLLLAISIVSCTPDELLVDGPLIEFEDVIKVIPDGNEDYLNVDSDFIFDQENLYDYELIIPQLSSLDKDPAAERYVEATLIFRGDTISPVGVRYKGSIGAFAGCLTGQDWLNPSGSKICSKLSMKVKINWEDTKDKFFDLKKLQFHAMNLDDSQLRERLAYYFYREMGVPAPRSVHAKLSINGNYAGLFALVEQIDGRFADFNYEDGSGNLYKEVWPISSSGSVHSKGVYKAALKTNEEIESPVDIIKVFAEEIVQTEDSYLKDVIRKWMDVDEIISLAVVDRTIRSDDGPFHWYCGGGGGCENHNYYWYEDPTRQKIHLIPWDMDNTFDNLLPPINAVTPVKDDWDEITNNCSPFNFGSTGFLQRSAACDKLIRAWVLFEEEYQDLSNSFRASLLSESHTNEVLGKWSAQIFEATQEADSSIPDAISMGQWQNALQNLKDELAESRK